MLATDRFANTARGANGPATSVFAVTPRDADVAATLETALAGANNDLAYTALGGSEGNDVTVRYVAGAALAVAVVGTAITVTFVNGVTTATLAKAAVLASDAAMALLAGVANKGGNDGSGLLATMAATPLTGGLDGELPYVTTGLWTGAGGDIAVVMADGSEATLTNTEAGRYLPVRVRQVKDAGTDATDIVGFC
jgi:hypothetical protein